MVGGGREAKDKESATGVACEQCHVVVLYF